MCAVPRVRLVGLGIFCFVTAGVNAFDLEDPEIMEICCPF